MFWCYPRLVLELTNYNLHEIRVNYQQNWEKSGKLIDTESDRETP